MEKLNALVTGASGFVGSHMVDYLLSKNMNVKVLTRKGSKLKWFDNSKVEVYDCGFYDESGLKEAVKDCHYIFHIGGVIKAKNTQGYFEGNQQVTRNLLNAVKEASKSLKRFVFVSSQAAVGPSPTISPIDETWECKPLTDYGRSKLAAEKEVLKEIGNIPLTVCRPPVVYGPRDPEVLLFFKTIKGGLHPLIGFSEKYVSIIHVRDLVEGIYLAALSEKALNQIYFISSDNFYGWNELGKISAELLNKKVIRLRIPEFIVFIVAGISQFLSYFKKEATILNLEKANEMVQKYWICSNEKAKRDFKFKPLIDIREGFKETIKWYIDQGWL